MSSADDHLLRNAVLSTNIELRRLATEGILFCLKHDGPQIECINILSDLSISSC